MSTIKEVKVPDLGSNAQAAIIEISVKVGDVIKREDTLITLESDKASMDIPAPFAGTIKELKVSLGDKVGTGSLILLIETEKAKESNSFSSNPPLTSLAETKPSNQSIIEKEVKVPDLGSSAKAAIIEISIKVGDVIKKDDTLITLESDKASMDIPAPFAGKIKTIVIKLGDKVGTGDLILTVLTQENTPAEKVTDLSVFSQSSANPPISSSMSATPSPKFVETEEEDMHAGPGVRRLAREFGIDLNKIKGTGLKQRIIKEDLQKFVKSALVNENNPTSGLPQAPLIDFSQFGEIESKPLTRIKKLTASHLHRNWVLIPHVTQFEECDITEMEDFRKSQQAAAEKKRVKLTPLVFIMKAAVTALKTFPQFNASLSADGESLILKKYFNIGVAVDTPEGLVVPVIRDVDKKNLFDLAKELSILSEQARDKKLTASNLQGSTFTISSLGGIGGTGFTPIVNLPDVAILGVSRATIKPVYQNGNFVPRLLLPLSLSYDHRVIDGAEGARFIVYLSKCLSDIRYWLL